jgi:UDP-N-acetylglucosamine 4,6-dehydratase
MINNKSILITGGTGSLGSLFVKYIVKNYKPKRLIIFSRDELKQYKMQQELPPKKYKNLMVSPLYPIQLKF